MSVPRSFVLSLSGLLASCALDDAEPSVDVDEVALVGAQQSWPANFIRIVHGGGTFEVLPAFLLRDNLAIGPLSDGSTPAPSPATQWRSQRPPVGTQPSPEIDVAYINRTQLLPNLGIYTVASGVANPGGNRLDTRSFAQLGGTVVKCSTYRRFAQAWQAVTFQINGGTSTELAAFNLNPGDFMHVGESDVGIPCTTLDSSVLVGTVRSARIERDNQGHIIRNSIVLNSAAALRDYVDRMMFLNDVRLSPDNRPPGPVGNQPRAEVWSIRTDGGAAMCMDIPFEHTGSGVDVQQFPCHAHLNQLFYVDRRLIGAPSDPPRLVSAVSGHCLDVEFGDAAPRRPLQQFTCHNGANQKWVRDADLQLHPFSAPALCASVVGGPLPTAAPLEQLTCVDDTMFPPRDRQQRWTFVPETEPR